MIPLLPVDLQVDFARHLGGSRKPDTREWPDGAELVMTREIKQRDLHPDPVYLALNRFWSRLTSLFRGTSRGSA